LTNLAAKAQRFYRTPTELGGGAQDFQNFELGRLDTTNANGSYRLYTSAPSAVDNPPAPSTANTSITTSVTDTIWIAGWGKEIGDNTAGKVKAYIAISPSSMRTTIVN
jgi:hypothetical protein